MRFTLDWPSAPTLPITIVAAARKASAGAQFGWASIRATSKRRIVTPSAAALVAVAMNAVIAVGAPSYTSGVHWWKGATDALKARPARASAGPVRKGGSVIVAPPRDGAWPIPEKSVEPVEP